MTSITPPDPTTTLPAAAEVALRHGGTPSTPPARRALAPRRHIAAYALYTALTSARFTSAIWLIYLAAHGYSPFAIGLFEMVFHLSKFIAEVPTGVFADLVGRRASLITACIVGALAELLFLAPAPALIVLSLALSGLCFAFRGGADTALLWGLAGEAGERATATHYSHLYSRMLLVMLAGEAIGTSAGGAMGSALAALPFLAQSALMLVAIIPLLALPEQRVATHHRGQPLAHVGAGLRAVRRDPALLCLLLLSGLLAGVFSTVSMYSQLFFSALGLSQAAIGLLFAVAIVPNALYAGFSPRLIARLPAVWLLGTCIVAEAMGLLAMRTAWLPLALPGFVLLFYATDALVMPAISRYLNERAPEAQRSVVLSLDTGLFSAVMIVLFPLFGFGLTHGSFTGILTWTLLALVGGGGAIGLTARWLLSRRGNARGAVNDTAGMTSQ